LNEAGIDFLCVKRYYCGMNQTFVRRKILTWPEPGNYLRDWAAAEESRERVGILLANEKNRVLRPTCFLYDEKYALESTLRRVTIDEDEIRNDICSRPEEKVIIMHSHPFKSFYKGPWSQHHALWNDPSYLVMEDKGIEPSDTDLISFADMHGEYKKLGKELFMGIATHRVLRFAQLKYDTSELVGVDYMEQL
jgi:hypothetical protein